MKKKKSQVLINQVLYSTVKYLANFLEIDD